MRERAQSLGGTFSIRERDGGGTIVTVTLPLETTAASTDAAAAAGDVMRAAG
jgi:nitrate/nitrite-specific signal transduction histidine kinase